MTTRGPARLGRTNVSVSPLGFGTGPIGGWPTPVASITDDEAAVTLEAAWDAGIRYYDTAPLYGLGIGEKRLGHFLVDRSRAEFVVSTKVGRLVRSRSVGDPGWPENGWNYDFTERGVRRSIDESLARTGLDRFDVLLIHDPDEHVDEALDAPLRVLRELRSNGLVGAIGAGMNWTPQLTRLVREGDFDCVMLAGRYTLLEQPALDDVLPTCLARGVSVLAAGVFNSGILAAPDGATYNYAEAPEHVRGRVRQIAEICDRYETPIAAAAIQFPLAHPAVASVVVGVRSRVKVEENARLLDVRIPGSLWRDLKRAGLLRHDAPTPSPAD
jgi:D-threo-aldose 1-dehydrogenase